ncbi:MAG: proprotein convertase P-domain-containing protein, partial [Flavobacteriales bacterium]|nr:proprotein convertase P-domain-containing protein [Flavobacteriales bacterium]
MKTLYTKTNTWRATALAVCSAFLLLCSTTVVTAQTTFGPFSATPAIPIDDPGLFDDLYDGTLGSMASSAIAVSGVTGDNVIDITVDVEITHTWEGDLVIKLQSPDGDILTLASRPGLAEAADDGTECCGNNSGLDGSTLTFSDAGVTDGEELGLFGEVNAGETICSGDGLCSYFPSPGATMESAASFADFFNGTMDGDWTLYVGDAGGGDFGV